MKSAQLLDTLHAYETYQELKKDMENIFTKFKFDPIKDKSQIDKINSNIVDYTRSLESEQEEFYEVAGFDVDLSVVDLRNLYAILKELKDEVTYLSGMSASWESADACEAAYNDPGLQYDQSEKVELLWETFKTTYNKKTDWSL